MRTEAENYQPTSATEIRRALTEGNRKNLDEKLGIPVVESYLMGLMYQLPKKINPTIKQK